MEYLSSKIEPGSGPKKRHFMLNKKDASKKMPQAETEIFCFRNKRGAMMILHDFHNKKWSKFFPSKVP